VEVLGFGFRSARYGEFNAVGGFELDRQDTAERAAVPCVVEPVDPAEGREFDVIDSPPWSSMDQLGLVEPVDRLGERVVNAGRNGVWLIVVTGLVTEIFVAVKRSHHAVGREADDVCVFNDPLIVNSRRSKARAKLRSFQGRSSLSSGVTAMARSPRV
jgi:hypothetical protein